MFSKFLKEKKNLELILEIWKRFTNSFRKVYIFIREM